LLTSDEAQIVIVEPNSEGITPMQMASIYGDKPLAEQLEKYIALLRNPNETLETMVRKSNAAVGLR
jgi:ankyrin repeat protein